MAISPIAFSRVSNNMRTLSLLDSLRRNTMSLFAEQNRLATGLRLNIPSDDPVDAARALDLSIVLDRQDQILANIRHADSFLGATDNALNEINDLVSEAKSIASDMVNTVVRADERESQAAIVGSIIDQLVAIGNRTYAGMQLFGGKQVLQQPFVRDMGGVLYTGDTTDMVVDIGGAYPHAVNLTGDALFGMTTGKIIGYQNLEPSVVMGTRLPDLKGATGLGVRLGIIHIRSNGGATSFNVDLSGCDTIGNIVDKINDAATTAGLGNIAGISGTGLQLDNGSGGTQDIEVLEIGNGTTATDLGIVGSDATGVIAGGNLHARIIDTTTLATLNAGAGVTLAAPIRISNGTKTVTVDLSAAQTMQDVLNAINTADVSVRAVINDEADGINIINLLSGSEMAISEVGGTTADQLGILSMHSGKLVTELNSGEGISTVAGRTDIRIVAKNGGSFEVSFNSATTVQDILDAINNAAATAGVAVTASLNPNGTGFRLDDATGGAGDLYIERVNGSFAIEDLGLLDKRSASGQAYLISDDPASVVPQSIFTALLDLQNALLSDDTTEINKAGQSLEKYVPQLIRVRGIVGARSKAAHDRVAFTEDAVQATRTLLSEVKDLDYTEAVTKFQQAQLALQANLQTGSKLIQISLLDFLG